MKYFLKLCIFILILVLYAKAYDINDKTIYQKDFENATIYLPVNNYRVLRFDTRIKAIQLTNSENIHADFIESSTHPLKVLKVLGKKMGNESAIVTLEDGKTIQINFSIMQNLDTIITIVKKSYPNLIIEQANDTIILKGYVKDYKEKDLVIDTFKKAGISIEEKLVDMIETSTPSKMIRVKLYAVEINNNDGIDLKNNWTLSSTNYIQNVDENNLFWNSNLDGTKNNQRMPDVTNAISNIMSTAVTLTGGLSGAANFLSEYFNTALVLQYLESEGVANILDETTLMTLENKDASFHAGGTIRIKTQTTTAEGVPSTDIEKINYGLQLDIKAKNVMKNNYIDLEITTSSTEIDWTNTVDDIPSFTEKEIKTNVLAKNGATIVLGGLISNENSYDVDQIPLLGDIPILGFLFKSKAFKEGKSELVFFITPEVVDPSVNNQIDLFRTTKTKMLNTSKYKEDAYVTDEKRGIADQKEDNKNKKEEQKSETSSISSFFKPKSKNLTNKELHQQRVRQILGD